MQDKEESVTLRAYLVEFIRKVIVFFGYELTATDDEQVVSIVNSIIKTYYYFRLADLKVCFDRAKTRSSYGKFYGRFDGSVILGWFSQYDKERDEAIQMMQDAQIQSVSSAPIGEAMSRREYEEVRLAKAAGGDMDAYAACIAQEKNKSTFWENRFQSGNYRYNQLHKYDKRDDMLAQSRKKKGYTRIYP